MSSADFDPGLAVGTVLTNKQLAETFECSTMGGMRRSKAKNSLVLTTSQTGTYRDRWEGDVLHYTGMGLRGDQVMNDGQNVTLARSPSTGTAVFLMEVFAPNQYVYGGRVVLAGEPYQEEQLDKDGKPRRVWMFPLRLRDQAELPPVSKELFEKAESEHDRAIKKLSDEERRRRARKAPRRPNRRIVTSIAYERDANVKAEAKHRAKGICQLCQQPAPFKSKKGEPYLETHHIVWLARAGEDSIENTVALCPNCHRRVHELEHPVDVEALAQRAQRNSR